MIVQVNMGDVSNAVLFGAVPHGKGCPGRLACARGGWPTPIHSFAPSLGPGVLRTGVLLPFRERRGIFAKLPWPDELFVKLFRKLSSAETPKSPRATMA